MEWYFRVLKKYAVIEGRARRMEYWMFFLINVIIGTSLGIIEVLLGIAPGTETSILGGIYGLAVMVPGIAVAVRRLHDTGRSGWWLFLGLIPIIGAIILLVFMVLDSEPGENQYGPNPKYAS